jgi:serine/threonine protein kinase
VIPETVGNYRILGPLGRSPTGVVFKGIAPDSNQPVALRLVAPGSFASAAHRQQFLAEARAATTLTHPRLRRLYEVGEEGDGLYLAMEYLEGSTLGNLLVSGPLEMETALAWAAEIAEGLAAAHEAGVVHGELFPGKVFVTKDGSVKVLDTGLWRLTVPTGVDISQEENLAAANVPAARVATLAPEQLTGREPDQRSDVFALGTIVYQMATGRQPFADASAVTSMYRVLRRTPQPVGELAPEAPQALDGILARALTKKPEGRYPSAAAMAAALREVAAGEERPAEVLLVPPGVEVAARRVASPLWWAIAAALLLLVVWFLYLALTPP